MQYDLKNNVICHSMFDEKELVAKKKKIIYNKIPRNIFLRRLTKQITGIAKKLCIYLFDQK